MYLNYCRGLKFEDVPDYVYLRQLFRGLFLRLNHEYDNAFDWKALPLREVGNSSSQESSELMEVETNE
jgi:hypothetical protein